MTTQPDTPKPSEFPPREIWVWIDGEGYYEVRDEQPNKVAERYILAPSPQESHKLAEELERLIENVQTGRQIMIDAYESDLLNFMIAHRSEVLAALRSSPSEQTSDARDADEAAEVAREKARLYDLIVARGMFVQPGDREWHVAADDGPWCDGNTLSEAINAAIAASGGAQGDGK